MHSSSAMVPTVGRLFTKRKILDCHHTSRQQAPSSPPVSFLSSSQRRHGLLYFKYYHTGDVRTRALRVHSTFYSSLSTSMILPELVEPPPCAIRSNNDNYNSQRILAMSSTISSSDTNTIRVLHRIFWQRLKSWWSHVCKAWLVAARSTEIVLRLSPIGLLAPMCLMTQSSHILDLTWRYTISAIQAMGPVAVKFCQWVATRRDIFPPQLCDRLGILHDRGFPHSWHHTQQVLAEAFGEDYQKKGLYIDKEDPSVVIGCGSAAQVYKGTLRTTSNHHQHKDHSGRAGSMTTTTTKTVAIKVLHPQFAWSVERDLSLLQTVAEWLHALPLDAIRMVNLPKATQNFGDILRLQADLTKEAQNLQQFRENFHKNHASIQFPQPISDWSHPNVLVEEYVPEAVPISTFLQDSTPEGNKIRRELAGPLLRAFLKMVFIDNFIHGDLHPGNVMVKTELVTVESSSRNTRWLVSLLPQSVQSFVGGSTGTSRYFPASSAPMIHHQRTIVFLDAGIANSLSPNDQRNLMDLFRAVILNDGNRAGKLMVERAKYERCSEVPGGVDAFAKGVQDIVSEFHDRRKEGLTLGAVRIGSLLGRVLDLCRVHGVEIDPAMASVVISTLVLEGLGRSLSPELNLIDFATPFVLGRGHV